MKTEFLEARQELRDAVRQWKILIQAGPLRMGAELLVEIDAVTARLEAGFDRMYDAIELLAVDVGQPSDDGAPHEQ